LLLLPCGQWRRHTSHRTENAEGRKSRLSQGGQGTFRTESRQITMDGDAPGGIDSPQTTVGPNA
jgi:hypothetical protein